MRPATRAATEAWKSGNTSCSVAGRTATTSVAHRSAIDGAAADAREVLGLVGRDAYIAAGLHKASGVVCRVSFDGDAQRAASR
jgi:hypothetical protein